MERSEGKRISRSKYRAGSRTTIEWYNTDADIVEWLNQQPKKQGYIKDLIRKDMEQHK